MMEMTKNISSYKYLSQDISNLIEIEFNIKKINANIPIKSTTLGCLILINVFVSNFLFYIIFEGIEIKMILSETTILGMVLLMGVLIFLLLLYISTMIELSERIMQIKQKKITECDMTLIVFSIIPLINFIQIIFVLWSILKYVSNKDKFKKYKKANFKLKQIQIEILEKRKKIEKIESEIINDESSLKIIKDLSDPCFTRLKNKIEEKIINEMKKEDLIKIHLERINRLKIETN